VPDQSFFVAIAGLLLLTAGGQLVVREAVTLAAGLRVSSLVIGMVVVGFGTSAPELATGIRAALSGAEALAYGNIIGATLANLLIVLPVAALLLPFNVPRSAIRAEATAVLVAAAMFMMFAVMPVMARAGGLIMLALLVSWLAAGLREQKRGLAPSSETGLQIREGQALVIRSEPQWRAILLLVIGIIALVAGADLLVSAATRFARRVGIGEDVLGLTLLSFGTCLPELATAIIAARRGQTDIVVGNVLGSCLFNLLAVGGAVLAISGTGPAGSARSFDSPALLLTAVLVIVLLVVRERLDRPVAIGLLLLYAAWLTARLWI
jgi:cation:H+ antiporter